MRIRVEEVRSGFSQYAFVNPLVTTTYFVQAVDSVCGNSGCGQVTVIVSPTGINPKEKVEQLRIFADRAAASFGDLGIGLFR
jgi:hypothetical protein